MLSALPAAVLCDITELLNARHIATLWSCGDTRLNELLGSGGGVKSFSFPIDSRFVSKWPSIVRHFACLTTLSIPETVYLGFEPQWTPNLLDLSPTVRNITLLMPQDLRLFIQALQANPHAFPELEYLSTSFFDAEDVIELLRFQASNLSNLTNLDLSGSHLECDLSLRDLPHTLTSLSLDIAKFDLTDGGRFPQGLESLVLSLCKEIPSAELFSLLPIGLRSLEIECDSHPFNVADLVSLPRGLTHLKLPMETTSIEHIQALSPHLTSLIVSSEIEREALAHLPRSLTSCEPLPIPTRETMEFFPPSLTLMDNVPFDCEIYGRLPASIKSLHLKPFDEEEERLTPEDEESLWRSALPASLTNLTGFDMRYLDYQPLPSSITDLYIVKGPVRYNHLRDNLLPQNLRILTANGGITHAECFPLLPRSLMILSMDQNDIEISMNAAEVLELPRNLNELCMGSIRLTEPDALKNLPTGLQRLALVMTIEKETLSYLPVSKTLSYLSISLPQGENLPKGMADHFFRNLPRSLIHVSLNGYGTSDVTDYGLENLPPGLCTLWCSMYADDNLLTGSCIPSLPKTNIEISFIFNLTSRWAREREGEK